MSTGVDISLAEVALTLVLVGLAAAVSLWRRADLEAGIAVAVARSFVQLTAIGYVIKLIFDHDELLFVVALLAVMVLFGALTARSRARRRAVAEPKATMAASSAATSQRLSESKIAWIT